MTDNLDLHTTYLFQNDLLEIKQTIKSGTFSIVKLHRNDIEMLADRFGLNDPIHKFQTRNDVDDDMRELFWFLRDHVQLIRKLDTIDLNHISAAINAYNKYAEICALMGLNTGSWVKNQPVDDNDLPF